MDAMDLLLAKAGKENRANEEKEKLTTEQVERQAQFLWGWSKGKPIVRNSADSTFWSKGCATR